MTAAEHVCFTYLFANQKCVSPLSPALKTRSVAQTSCACGASVQSMPPKEQRELSVRVRATAGRTSAAPFSEVRYNATPSQTDLENKAQTKTTWPDSVNATRCIYSMWAQVHAVGFILFLSLASIILYYAFQQHSCVFCCLSYFLAHFVATAVILKWIWEFELTHWHDKNIFSHWPFEKFRFYLLSFFGVCRWVFCFHCNTVEVNEMLFMAQM